MKGLQINRYLSLKFEKGNTVIYVANRRFKQCKFLFLNISVDNIELLEEIESIDEIAEKLDNSYEYEENNRNISLDPKTEFWGHCSNLQVWYEHGYNTNLLHRNLAFPLLHELAKAGDPEARKSFTEEIASRIESGSPTVINYLVIEEYLNYLPKCYLESLSFNDGFLEKLTSNIVNKPHFKRKLLEFISFLRSDDSDKRRGYKFNLEDVFRVYEEIYNSHDTDELEINFLDGIEVLLWKILKKKFDELFYDLEPKTVVNLFKIYDNDDFYFINDNIVLNRHIIIPIIDRCFESRKLENLFESEFEIRLGDKKIYSIVNLVNNYVRFSNTERINPHIENLIVKLLGEPSLSEASNFIRLKVLRYLNIKVLEKIFSYNRLGLLNKIQMVIDHEIDYETFNWSFNELKEYNYHELRSWLSELLRR